MSLFSQKHAQPPVSPARFPQCSTMAQGNLAIKMLSAAQYTRTLADSPPVQSNHPARRERKVGVGVALALADEGVATVEHGGDEETVADRANLACGNVFERGGGEVAPAAQVGAQVSANPDAGHRKGRLTGRQFTTTQGNRLFLGRVCTGLKARCCQRRMVGEDVRQGMGHGHSLWIEAAR
jgi:hypothetical protein